ncbi:MAG: DUF58 domain-containing protein [Lachnospiraceae bacterium]|nr:DUF58 domain-containing protein [Lachnospiraceae bacterium]
MYIVFAALLALLLYEFQYILYKKKWFSGLKTDAYFKISEAMAGDEGELTEVIENQKGLPLPMVKVKLQLSRKLEFAENKSAKVSDYFYRTDIYAIGANTKVTRTIKFTCRDRGYYDFHGVDVVGTDLFFSWDFVESVNTSSCLYVYPKPYSDKILRPLLDRINNDVVNDDNLTKDPFEIKGIREYQPFDSYKDINWKASAKTEELMVNVHDSTAKKKVRVLLNLENSMIMKRDELNELCISMAIATIIYFCKKQVEVSLYANSADVLTGEPIRLNEGSSESHIRSANRLLARIDLSKEAVPVTDFFSDYVKRTTDDVYTIVISPNMQKDFQDLLVEALNQSLEFSWLCPEYRDNPFEVDDRIKDRFISVPAEEVLYEISLS